MIATVRYDIATYSGQLTVNCDENELDEEIIARAKSQLRRQLGVSPYPGGPCYESWRVLSRGGQR